MSKKIAMIIAVIVIFVCSTAESCTSGGGACDVTGKNTALTTCAYQVLNTK